MGTRKKKLALISRSISESGTKDIMHFHYQCLVKPMLLTMSDLLEAEVDRMELTDICLEEIQFSQFFLPSHKPFSYRTSNTDSKMYTLTHIRA